jgi:hypothetical protein
MASKRTTHRSSKGTKLYAVRDKKGQFKDVQTYKKARGQDIKRASSDEYHFSSVTIVRPVARPKRDSEATIRRAVREVMKYK